MQEKRCHYTTLKTITIIKGIIEAHKGIGT